MAIIAKQIPMHDFHFDRASKTFTAEVSCLGRGSAGYHLVFSQIYDDACDVGFSMLSKTGAVVTFHHSTTDKHGEDIAGWHFVPTSESVRRVPAAADLSVLVIND